ncbi:hypothetical protein C1638_005700 [Chryseobacterium oncorhynchi]|uniref:Uncharacterized protein n=2 Tax=Chryseobacterium oncorhynchi TaxID=741074 RepID=A0A316WXI6_9FLAO|nr:hypothetical protein C1638_005700 [Chryseobacterium oncorhynchi]
MSCKKDKKEYNNVLCSFQNLVCDYPVNDSINIKNLETFLLFKNNSDDTMKISLKEFQENYRHVYKMDSLKINFEAISPISIPPHDSLGLPCISAVNRKVYKNDIILKDGFSVINVKTKEILPKTLNYRIKQMHDFQLYKKWGKKSSKVEL